MTFLPIVERELRVRARSKGWHWTRFGVVTAGALVCVPGLLWRTPGGPAEVGRGVFTGLIAAAFLLSCGACLLTADVISSERREGTLILLFLTRVKSFDVLLGKLASAGLAGFCALVACAPLLIIPVLAGGVTGGEAVRKSLVLMDTMFMALAAGIWASAKGRGWLKRARAAVLMMGVIVLWPAIWEFHPVIWMLVGVCLLIFLSVWAASRKSSSVQNAAASAILIAFLIAVPVCVEYSLRPARLTTVDVGLLSPLVGLKTAGDLEYKASHARFWISLGLIYSAGWALLAAAAVRLSKGLRIGDRETGKVEGAGGAARDEQPNFEDAPDAMREESGRYLRWSLRLHRDPIEWLLEGQRGMKALVWSGAAVGFFQYGLLPLFIRFIGFRSSSTLMWPMGFAVTVLQGVFFAAAASWFFVHARRSGELELLMTTPVGATTIISAQWNRLKRIFQWPTAVMAAPIPLIGLFNLIGYRGYPRGSIGGYFLLNSLLSAVEVVFGVAAICWTGLWFGLKSRSLAGAIIWTVGLGKGVPFLITILAQIGVGVIINRFAFGNGSMVWLVILAPQAAVLWYYVKLIQWARKRLVGQFAAAPVTSFRLNRSCEMAMTDVK